METKENPRKKISILILTYEGESIIQNCIDGVIQQSKACFDIEILVLDNGSTDRTYNIIKNINGIKILKNKVNKSFTSGFNKLYRQSTGDYILILSNDVFLEDKNFLTKAFNFLEDNINYGAYAPKSTKSDGTIERIAKREINLSRLFLDYTILGPLIRKFFPATIIGSKDYKLNKSIEDVDVLQDSCLFINKQVLTNQDVFDEKMKFYYTEDYLCDFIRSNGYKLFYSTESHVKHLYRFSTKKMGKLKVSWIYTRDAIFFSANKYGNFISFFILAPMAYTTLFFRVIAWLFKGKLSWTK